MIEAGLRGRHDAAAGDGQAGIMEGDGLALASIEPARDPGHLLMLAAAVRIGLHLPFEISRVQRRQPRHARAIAEPVQAVAGEAGIARPRAGAAERDQPSVLGKSVERSGLAVDAARKQGCRGEEGKVAHPAATRRRARWFRPAALAMLLLPTMACKPPPDQRRFTAVADSAQGKSVIERVGCGSCHRIPGIAWPQGKVGPSLDGLAERALIAGKLPNRPDLLAGYIRNAPALVPGSGMPAMPVSEAEARDIAAYLYEQGAR